MPKQNAKVPSRLDPEGYTLTIAQSLFVTHLLGDCHGNPTDAAAKARFAHPKQAAYRLMRTPAVKAAIAARLDKYAMTLDELLIRQTEVATASMEDFYTPDPNSGRPRLDWKKAEQRGKLHLVKKIKYTLYGPEVELHDPMAAQDRLIRVHGGYNDRMNVVHSIDWDAIPTEMILAYRNGEITIDQLPRRQHASLPLTIEGEGRIHDVDPDGAGSAP